jgi:hypothetical protein
MDGFHGSLRVTFGQSKQQKEAMCPLGAVRWCLPPTTMQLQYLQMKADYGGAHQSWD